MIAKTLKLTIVLMIIYQTVSPAHADECRKRCEPFLDIKSDIQDTCLTNIDYKAELSLSASFSTLEKWIKGDASVSAGKALGASRDLEDTLEQAENVEIRSCMGDFRTLLLKCVSDTIQICTTDRFPPELTLQLGIDFKNQDSEFFDKQKLVFGVKTPPRFKAQRISYPEDGWYTDVFATPTATGKYHAIVNRVVRDGFSPPRDKRLRTEFCLKRSQQPPINANTAVFLSCDEGKSCTFDDFDPGWTSFCPVRNGAIDFWPSLIGTAHASQHEGVEDPWFAPSLATLNERFDSKDIQGVGFIEFDIQSEDIGATEADGVSADLFVNDRRVLIDGLEPDFLVEPYNDRLGLNYTFALQTLNFSGHHGGCDIVSANFHFFRDGKPVHKPLKVSFPHVALRNAAAERADIRSDNHSFQWNAAYRKPLNAFENEVFVASSLAKNWEEKSLRKVQKEMEQLQTRFDALGLQFNGRPLRSVIRPPLTKPSFGLAVAVIEKSGQLRFTFPIREARRLLDRMMEVREESPAIRAIVRSDSFIYSIKGSRIDDEPPNVCAHLEQP